jgi:Protein of unknown function (DUF2637)
VSAADRAIRASATAAVLGVATIAAYISYWHAYEVISAHGESGATARLEPATIDGLVYCSSMVVLYAARHQLRVPALARWLLALGIVATLAANLAHGWSNGPIGAAVAAWPAASLVGSYELLLWLIRTASTSTTARTPGAGHIDELSDQLVPGLRLVPGLDSQQADSPRLGNVAPERPGHCGGLVIDVDRTSGPSATDSSRSYEYLAPWPMADAAAHDGGSEGEINAAAVAAYRASLDNRQPLSERKLAAMFGRTSRRWARHRMAEARRDGQQEPGPSSIGAATSPGHQ